MLYDDKYDDQRYEIMSENFSFDENSKGEGVAGISRSEGFRRMHRERVRRRSFPIENNPLDRVQGSS